MAASSSSSSPNPIPPESFANAVEALLKWIQSQPKHQKSQLFEPDDLLYLILTINRIPSKGRTNPYRIPIPNPLHPFDPESTSLCLILDDRPSSPLLPSSALDQIRTRKLPISSVIGLSDLKSDYRPFESRRKLCDSYDLFFADRKIIPLLPRLLGKHFFKRKKIPLAVDCSRVGWVEQIKSWCESSLLYLRTGTCSGLKIGRVTQSVDEIVENAVAAIEGAMEVVPKKWGNLRSVHVKTVESVALPVYQAVPEIGLKIEGLWDEKGESFKKGKKRARGEEGKKEKKEKKARIHDAGLLDEDGDGDGEVVSGAELILNDDNVEEEANDELEMKKKGKKSGLVEKIKKLMKKMDEDVVVASDVKKKSKRRNKEDDYDEEEVNDELMKKKKKAKKAGKTKEGKGEEDEESEEENVGSELSEKKIKKKKKKKTEDDKVVALDKKKSEPKKFKNKDLKKSKKAK